MGLATTGQPSQTQCDVPQADGSPPSLLPELRLTRLGLSCLADAEEGRGGDCMPCRSCASDNQREFSAEINIHFPGLKNLDKSSVFVFPRLLVCLNCGFAEFNISESELRLLAQDVQRDSV